MTELRTGVGLPTGPGGAGPAERWSVIAVAVVGAMAPFSLFAIAALWIARGLGGWEYALLAIPFAFALAVVALEGYRLYREPHVGRAVRVPPVTQARRRPPPGLPGGAASSKEGAR